MAELETAPPAADTRAALIGLDRDAVARVVAECGAPAFLAKQL